MMIGDRGLSGSCTFFRAVLAAGSRSSSGTTIAHRVSNQAGGGRSAPDRCRAVQGYLVNRKRSNIKERK